MQKSVFYGSAASFILLLVYFGILTAVESFGHALQQFAELWYLMIPLVIGFGLQIGLYFHIREGFKFAAVSGTTGSVASSGGMSAGSMALCCLHHVTDVLPLVGLSAAALFLAQYQPFFLVLGILSNIVGIFMMFNIMQKHGLQPKAGFLSGIFNFNMKNMRNGAIISSGIILTFLFLFTAYSTSASSDISTAGLVSGNSDGVNLDISGSSESLQMLINSEGRVSIDVTPLDFEFGKKVIFDMGLNTHQGSLDFDVAEIATLEDSNGNVYSPLEWEGSPPGGHHRYGKLTFPPIENSNYMELTLKNIYGVPERVFRWELGGG